MRSGVIRYEQESISGMTGPLAVGEFQDCPVPLESSGAYCAEKLSGTPKGLNCFLLVQRARVS